MVKFIKTKPRDGASGPSSAIGITRFFDASSKSPQISPYFIVVFAIVFIVLVLVAKHFWFVTP